MAFFYCFFALAIRLKYPYRRLMKFLNTKSSISLAHVNALPIWRRPMVLLVLMSIAMPVSYSTWMALLNNFVIEVAEFDGVKIGWLHGVREIPGFLAVGVIALLLFFKEINLAILSLVALGFATAVTAYFPSMSGLLITTFIASVGFHYYETAKQSLELQWIEKKKAPKILGWLVAVGSAASLCAYVLIVLGWRYWNLTYEIAYGLAGSFTIVIAIICWLAFPKFENPTKQKRQLIFRKRYWLYYALNFAAGARRQIFIVFAAFMMVEKFGFQVHELTALFIINYIANIIFAPLMGLFVNYYGERTALCLEYLGLTFIFLAYGGIYYFGWGAGIAMGLYVLDHLFFALAFAQKTYFQKIADPSEIASTAAVVFTINHIPAVFLPVILGYFWINSPAFVFVVATLLAITSFLLALMIPKNPNIGNETIFSKLIKNARP